MKTKNLLSVILAIVLLFGVTTANTSAHAAALASGTIDNDDISGNSNRRYGFDSYVTGSQHYNGDARRQATSGNSDKYYDWVMSTGLSKIGYIHASLSVYINDANFLDAAAHYYMSESNNFTFYPIGTLNQRYAPGGWSTFSTVDIPALNADGSNMTNAIELVPSGSGSGYTGADAVRYTIS